jgi:hypothetical protein
MSESAPLPVRPDKEISKVGKIIWGLVGLAFVVFLVTYVVSMSG